jgi:hypothetical protein
MYQHLAHFSTSGNFLLAIAFVDLVFDENLHALRAKSCLLVFLNISCGISHCVPMSSLFWHKHATSERKILVGCLCFPKNKVFLSGTIRVEL